MKVLILLTIISFAFPMRINNVKNVALNFVGSYSGVNEEGIVFEKTYYLSQYLKATSINARSACKSYGSTMDLATFETREEFLKIKINLNNEIERSGQIGSNPIIVGGLVHTLNGKSDYYWFSTGSKVNHYPFDANRKDLKCLALQKEGAVAYIPINCDEKYLFICQDVEYQYTN